MELSIICDTDDLKSGNGHFLCTQNTLSVCALLMYAASNEIMFALSLILCTFIFLNAQNVPSAKIVFLLKCTGG